jgi:hypothetical protein
MAEYQKAHVASPEFVYKALAPGEPVTRIAGLHKGNPEEDVSSIIRYSVRAVYNQFPSASVTLGMHFVKPGEQRVQEFGRNLIAYTWDFLNERLSTQLSPVISLALQLDADAHLRHVFAGKATNYSVSGGNGQKLLANLNLRHIYADLHNMDLSWLSGSRVDYILKGRDSANYTISDIIDQIEENADGSGANPGADAWMATQKYKPKDIREDQVKTSFSALLWAVLEIRYKHALTLYTGNDSPTEADIEAANDEIDASRGSTRDKDIGEVFRVAYQGPLNLFIHDHYPKLRNILERSVAYTRAAWCKNFDESFMNKFVLRLYHSNKPWQMIHTLMNEFGYQLMTPMVWRREEETIRAQKPDEELLDGNLIPFFALDDPFAQVKDPLIVDSDYDTYTSTPYGGLPISHVITKVSGVRDMDLYIAHASTLSETNSNGTTNDDTVRYNNLEALAKLSNGDADTGAAAWPINLKHLGAHMIRQTRHLIVTAPMVWEIANEKLSSETRIENKINWQDPDQIISSLNYALRKLDEFTEEDSKAKQEYRSKLNQFKTAYSSSKENPVSTKDPDYKALYNSMRSAESIYIKWSKQNWLRLYSCITFIRRILDPFVAGPFSAEMTPKSFLPLTGLRYSVYPGYKGDKENHYALFTGRLSSTTHNLDMSQARPSLTVNYHFDAVLSEARGTLPAYNVREFLRKVPSLSSIYFKGEVPSVLGDALPPGEATVDDPVNMRPSETRSPLALEEWYFHEKAPVYIPFMDYQNPPHRGEWLTVTQQLETEDLVLSTKSGDVMDRVPRESTEVEAPEREEETQINENKG